MIYWLIKEGHSLNKPSSNSLLSFYYRIILTFRSRFIYMINLFIVNYVKMLSLKHKKLADIFIILPIFNYRFNVITIITPKMGLLF